MLQSRTTTDTATFSRPVPALGGARRVWAWVAFPIIGALAAVATLVPADGHALRRDRRLAITNIRDGSIVPNGSLAVEWTAHPSAEVAGYVTVLDRSMQPVGAGLAHYVAGDDRCDGNQVLECLTPDYLDDYHVYVSTDPRVTIPLVADRGGSKSTRRRHEVTVAPLDRFGRRLGDATATVRFFVPPRSS